MNTQENNRLIAKFMGMTYGDLNDDSVMIQMTPKGNEVVPIELMEYHTSWDWLMPVVEKIEREYMYAVQPCWEHCIIDKAGENTEDFERIEVDSCDKLSATYGAVVEFIKWYNMKTQPSTIH